MKIYTVANPVDTAFLRSTSSELTPAEILSPAYRILSDKLIKTVTASTVDGVGIAAPQIGIARRLIAVQRFDKEGEPFEVFPNLYITEYSTKKETGKEGCISIPDRYGEVERSEWVIISYTHPTTLETVQDTVKGFTARIFQHEADHLEGVLYTDKIIPDCGI